MRAFIVFWNINCEMQFSISFQFIFWFFYFFGSFIFSHLLEIPKFGNFWYNIVRTLYFQLKKEKKREKRSTSMSFVEVEQKQLKFNVW